ncbi:MAG TPA: glycosyltransferase family 9 protein [Chthoniobacterales bacterium]|nr:glycosyltransferase family 9 protein [Chthoniobacterales bacterium]
MGERRSAWLDARDRWARRRRARLLVKEDLRFLVLRGGALGDVLLTLPTLRALQNSGFVELAAPFPAALVARYGGAHAVNDLNSATFLSLFTEGGGLDGALCEKLHGVDCVICYLFDPQQAISAKIKNCGCRFVSGPFRLDQEQLPAAVQLAEPLMELGVFVVDPVPRLFVERQLSSRSRFVFHVGSGSPTKNWPTIRWAGLAAKLEERFDELLLVSGEADETYTAEFLRQYRNANLNVRSNLPVLDLAHELAAADLFIGHDTGVTHLAAALGIPTIALFGPTDPMIWRPLGDNVQVVSSENETMGGLSLEQVWETVRRLDSRRTF